MMNAYGNVTGNIVSASTRYYILMSPLSKEYCSWHVLIAALIAISMCNCKYDNLLISFLSKKMSERTICVVRHWQFNPNTTAWNFWAIGEAAIRYRDDVEIWQMIFPLARLTWM